MVTIHCIHNHFVMKILCGLRAASVAYHRGLWMMQSDPWPWFHTCWVGVSILLQLGKTFTPLGKILRVYHKRKEKKRKEKKRKEKKRKEKKREKKRKEKKRKKKKKERKKERKKEKEKIKRKEEKRKEREKNQLCKGKELGKEKEWKRKEGGKNRGREQFEGEGMGKERSRDGKGRDGEGEGQREGILGKEKGTSRKEDLLREGKNELREGKEKLLYGKRRGSLRGDCGGKFKGMDGCIKGRENWTKGMKGRELREEKEERIHLGMGRIYSKLREKKKWKIEREWKDSLH